MSLIIALGSNIGDLESNLFQAIHLLTAKFGSSKQQSRIYVSSAIGVTDQPNFLNMVVEFPDPKTPPDKVLDICLSIEQDMGRKRVRKWGPRLIDIDILFYNNYEVTSSNLIIPHPFINDRDFVLLPLMDLKVFTELSTWFKFSRTSDQNCKVYK